MIPSPLDPLSFLASIPSPLCFLIEQALYVSKKQFLSSTRLPPRRGVLQESEALAVYERLRAKMNSAFESHRGTL